MMTHEHKPLQSFARSRSISTTAYIPLQKMPNSWRLWRRNTRTYLLFVRTRERPECFPLNNLVRSANLRCGAWYVDPHIVRTVCTRQTSSRSDQLQSSRPAHMPHTSSPLMDITITGVSIFGGQISTSSASWSDMAGKYIIDHRVSLC